MNRRSLLLASTTIWLGLLLGSSLPAIAKDGDSGSDHSGSGDGGSDDNSGHGGGGDSVDNSGHGNAEGRGDGDDGRDDDNGGNRGDDDRDDDGHDGGDESGDPIPLRDMLAIFAGYGDLTVVDVGLIHRSGGLQYKFRYIDGQGRVRNAYFDALTGDQAH